MSSKFTESTVEEAVLEWADGLAYAVLYGPEIAPEEPAAERESFGEVLLLMGRLRDAIERINPKVPAEAQDEALRRVIRTETANLLENNRRFHRMLVDGIDVEYQADGRTVHDKVWLVDFANPENNDWLAVNQYTVIENKHNRRPDVVLFVNGLPLVVIELKSAADENATTKKAFDQLQTYKLQLPMLMTYNVCLVATYAMRLFPEVRPDRGFGLDEEPTDSGPEDGSPCPEMTNGAVPDEDDPEVLTDSRLVRVIDQKAPRKGPSSKQCAPENAIGILLNPLMPHKFAFSAYRVGVVER